MVGVVIWLNNWRFIIEISSILCSLIIKQCVLLVMQIVCRGFLDYINLTIEYV